MQLFHLTVVPISFGHYAAKTNLHQTAAMLKRKCLEEMIFNEFAKRLQIHALTWLFLGYCFYKYAVLTCTREYKISTKEREKYMKHIVLKFFFKI